MHPDDHDRIRVGTDRLLLEGGSDTMDLRVGDRGGWRWVRTTIMAETQKDGRVVLHGLEQDVTELAAAVAHAQVHGVGAAFTQQAIGAGADTVVVVRVHEAAEGLPVDRLALGQAEIAADGA